MTNSRSVRSIAVLAALAVGGAVTAGEPLSARSPRVLDLLTEPVRIVDTRPSGTTVDGTTAALGALPAGNELTIPVAGRGGVPSAGVDAVAVNVTIVDPAEAGHVTLYPCDAMRPPTSNQFANPGETRAVLAIVELSVDGTICLYNHGATHAVVDLMATFGTELHPLPPERLSDTRVDGEPVAGGDVLRVPLAGSGLPADATAAVVGTTVVATGAPGHATVRACGTAHDGSTVNFGPSDTVANLTLVPLGSDGHICVETFGTAHVVVDLFGSFGDGAVAFPNAGRRVLDTRAGQQTTDGAWSGIGVRPPRSALALPVAGRAGVPDDAGAVVLNVTAVGARAAGHVTVHAGGVRPSTSNLNVDAGETIANAVVSQIGPDGAVCLANYAATHLVVDVVAWFPGVARAPETGCVPDRLFPGHRMVALYGNDVAAVLGVLGEQPPDAAADRLAGLAAPYRAGDRPVIGAFELIATIATNAPGPSGLYRSPSSAAHVQRYLDAANANGLELILDIQPGRGDFLTELRRYEEFLRLPNVHAALDPEWHVDSDQVPGEVVGQVSAFEVNRVADYLADLVAEEGLPEKLLVVHQFQDRMLTNRSALREPVGVAVTIHMDGFGTRSQKLATYDVVQVDEPFSNGFKLFFDEDIELFSPSEVLALDPAPDLITYQ